MSWKFGPFTVASQEVVDIERINENFYSIIEEVTGELNEHNWAADAFNTRADLADGVAIRVGLVQDEEEPNTMSSRTAVAVATDWHELVTDFNYTLDNCKGGLLWVLVSFQIMTDQVYGANFAIELDGTVLGESLVGSGDIGNDWIPTDSTHDLYGLVGPLIHYANDGGPVVIEVLVPVAPGQHVIRPVVRNPEPQAADTDATMFIANREIIVLELS